MAQGLFETGLFVLVGLLLAAMLGRSLRGLKNQGYLSSSGLLIGRSLGRWLLGLVILTLVLDRLGLAFSQILTGLLTVAGMVAIGFIAVWSVLSNAMSALLLLAFKTFRIGDELEIIEPTGSEKGLSGRVSGFSLMFTTLEEKGAKGEIPTLIHIPNNIFFQKSLRHRAGNHTESLGQHLLATPLSAGLDAEQTAER
jgi:small-conductance mechanosensitive channel